AQVAAKLRPLIDAGKVVRFARTQSDDAIPITADAAALLAAIGRLCRADIVVSKPQPDLRIRHSIKAGDHFYILFNEGAQKIDTEVCITQTGALRLIDTATCAEASLTNTFQLTLAPHETKLLGLKPS
ncbi:MAG: hypothetical protein H7144_03950, partial [Burkholderiales bacterium]|nr:hypothetical protein [Phycisphaerae bacterium]